MKTPRFGVIAALLGILSLTLAASLMSERRYPDSLARSLKEIPLSLAGWSYAGDAPLPNNALQRLVPTDYVSRVYTRNGANLGLLVAFYAEQRSGESMHSPKHCLPGSGWEIWKYSEATLPVNGREVAINVDSIENEGTRDIILYWYQSRNEITASEFVGKIRLVRDTLLTGHTAGALVRILLSDTPEARAQGLAFAQQLVPEVQASFGNIPATH
jgi:EpsI family protein